MDEFFTLLIGLWSISIKTAHWKLSLRVILAFLAKPLHSGSDTEGPKYLFQCLFHKGIFRIAFEGKVLIKTNPVILLNVCFFNSLFVRKISQNCYCPCLTFQGQLTMRNLKGKKGMFLSHKVTLGITFEGRERVGQNLINNSLEFFCELVVWFKQYSKLL